FGVVVGVFIHDILPMTAPEYFEARDRRVFVKGAVEALAFADFALTTSEYNKTALTEHMKAQRALPLPLHLISLGRQPARTPSIKSDVSDAVAGILKQSYVLCVGTIEVRKNPTYLFN